MDPVVKRHIPILNDANLFSFKSEVLSENPPILLIKNLLTPGECQHIINLARNKLNYSTMIIDNKEVVNPSRSSRSAFITKNGSHPENDAVIHRFLARLAAFTGFPLKSFEGMKVVNYQKGQKYLPHYDYFREHDNFVRGCGDRQLTFFVYLNTLSEQDGGCTSFPNLNLKVRPSAGDAVFWVNMDFDGNYYEDTLHGGDEIQTDIEKWGINVWIRQRPYA